MILFVGYLLAITSCFHIRVEYRTGFYILKQLFDSKDPKHKVLNSISFSRYAYSVLKPNKNYVVFPVTSQKENNGLVEWKIFFNEVFLPINF